MDVKARTARLTTGRPSTETHTVDVDSLLRELGGREKKRGQTVPTTSSRSSSSSLAPPASDGGLLTERVAWQAFVLCLQMHFPDMAAEIDPAHRIGRLPPRLVRLSVDAISFLNHFVESWYGGEVEVQTVTVARKEKDLPVPGILSHMKPPFRPVTGLNVIVVPTIQRALVAQERNILGWKEKMSFAKGLLGLDMGRTLYTKEEWGGGNVRKEKEHKPKKDRGLSFLRRR